MRNSRRIICGKCKSFFVTHNKYKPWGCKRFGFKSQNLPSQVIFSTTGTNCAYFIEKEVFVKNKPSQVRNERM